MPVHIATDLSHHMPPFSPTFEDDLGGRVGVDSGPHKQNSLSHHFADVHRSKPLPTPAPQASFHFHRDSASTAASDSTSSSPTTTVSLSESFHTNGDTPITSPDTPASIQSLSDPTLKAYAASRSPPRTDPSRHLPPPAELTRPSTGFKKARNLKNLAVDTSGPVGLGRAVATANLPIHQYPNSPSMVSGPASPAFLKPLKPPKRKSSNLGLSIVTPASTSPPVQLKNGVVPPTPSLARPPALRHCPSSPALTLISPSGPPEGGMRLPPLCIDDKVSVEFHEPPLEQAEDDPHRFDVPQSREEKPAAYPDGPICIYDPHVYLYYEPTAQQASTFDVVINVASEVKNPFAVEKETDKSSTEHSASPTTPKATPGLLRQPEYIHIPWEHNTDIVPDLYDLCRQIDDRVRSSKKVLIHCQCGVSRSASLIVAYGIYKNPSITVQEAYDAVKRRSKWIGPNMSLIMQLQEFRTELLKSSAGMPSRHFRQRSNTRLAYAIPATNSERMPSNGTSQDSGPRSAPLPPETHRNLPSPIVTSDSRSVASGPSSAPSGMSWPTDQSSRLVEKTGNTNRLSVPDASRPGASEPEKAASNTSSSQPPVASDHDANKRPAPLKLPVSHLTRFGAAHPATTTESPRAAEFAMVPAKFPTPDETFGLTSPRDTGFGAMEAQRSFFGRPQVRPAQPKPAPSMKSLTSPRSEQFGMSGIRAPPMEDDTFGLTSPKETTFASLLPLRGAPSGTYKAKAFQALQPAPAASSSSSSLQPNSEAGDRASLRRSLGMSTSSSYDLRSEYVSAAKARALRPMAPPQRDSFVKMQQAHDDLSDALMSPRATEFTSNPFAGALGLGPEASRGAPAQSTLMPAQSGTSTPKPAEKDPRSPAQKGQSPIIRNIFDVLES